MYKTNDVIDAMISRRSIRKYKSDMIPKEAIDLIIKSGTFAASAMGMQDAIIIAVTNKDARDHLSEMNRKIGGWEKGFDPFYGAPVVLVVLAEKSMPNRVYDGSLVMGNLMLAAHSLGIGSCWIHRAKEEFESKEGIEILKSININGDYEGIGHCVLGYPAEDIPAAPERKENRVFYID